MAKNNFLGLGGLLVLTTMMMTSCSFETTDDSSSSNGTQQKETTKSEFTLGKKFTFDGLEITLGSKAEFTTVDNEFSNYYESDIVKLSANIKNIKNESNSLNVFSFSTFGSKGTKLDSVNSYFEDSVGLNADDLQPGASYNKAFYLPYDGDGTYKIEFGFLKTEVKAMFSVTIGDNSIVPTKDEYNIGETFRFDFFEIKAEETSITTIDNQFSDWYNKDVIRVPLTIKNLGKESRHLNPYRCTIFGPDGVEIDTVDTYFEDSIGWGAGDLAPNASYTRAFYAKSAGNGKYIIEFENIARTIKLAFTVNK